ncbi:MAG: phage terminase small subunit [Negativibacillus sp.]
MPRPRSPNRDKAFELWLESGKSRTIKNISEELGVSENQVRKWKNQDNWENREALPNVTISNGNNAQTNGNVTNQSKPAKRKRGGQKGNQNRYEHGLYANPTMDMIPRQELERLQRMDFEDEESIIIDEIILLTSRERQLLESIQRYQDQKNGLSLDGVTRRVVENEGARDSRSKQVETTTRTRDVFDVIQKLQAELTKVQKEKRQYLSELRILRTQKAQMPKEENTHERVLQEISSEELRQFIEGEW